MTSATFSSGKDDSRTVYSGEDSASLAGATVAADSEAEDAASGSARVGSETIQPACAAGAEDGRAGQTPRRRGTRSRAALVRHDFAVALRTIMPIALVALVVFALLMPVSTAVIPSLSIFNVNYTHDQLKYRFWLESLTYAVYFCVVLYGLALGLRSFRFLLVKTESTTFLNLPLPRQALFITRVGACFVALLIGIGVPLGISLALNVGALGAWRGIFADFFFVLCGLLLVGALACAVAQLCCALSGTQTEAGVFSLALLSSVTIGAWGFGALAKELLTGNAAGEYLYGGTVLVAPSLVEQSMAVNPLVFFLPQMQEHYTFTAGQLNYFNQSGNWLLLGVWTLVFLAILALAMMLFIRRKGERAGVAGLCPALVIVTGLVVGMAAFGAAFEILAEVDLGVALAAAFGLFLCVCAIMLRKSFRGVARLRTMLVTTGAECVCLVGVVLVVATGGLGYSSYLPESQEVSAVQVTYTGSPDALACSMDTASAGGGTYYYSGTYTLTDAADISMVQDVHKQLTATGHAAFARNTQNFAQTVVPYDLRITYTLTDGRQVLRYYDRATYAELFALCALDESASVRELQYACITGDLSGIADTTAAGLAVTSFAHRAYEQGDIYLSDAAYAAPVALTCTDDARAALLRALATDLTRQSAEDRYHSQAETLGVLMFTLNAEQDASSFAYALTNTVIYLTPEYRHTLSWLQDYGLEQYIGGIDDNQIESLTFQRYDPYAGINANNSPQSAVFMGYRSSSSSQYVITQDFGARYQMTDAEEIAQVVPLMKNTYFVDGGGYLVCAKLAGVDAYAYFFLPDDQVSDELRRMAG